MEKVGSINEIVTHPGTGAVLALPWNFFEHSGQSQTFPVNHVYDMDNNNSRNLNWGGHLLQQFPDFSHRDTRNGCFSLGLQK